MGKVYIVVEWDTLWEEGDKIKAVFLKKENAEKFNQQESNGYWRIDEYDLQDEPQVDDKIYTEEDL